MYRLLYLSGAAQLGLVLFFVLGWWVNDWQWWVIVASTGYAVNVAKLYGSKEARGGT